MKCKINEKILALYVGGELPRRKASKIDAHIKSCSQCAERVEELKWSSVLLKQKTELPELSPHFWQQLKSETLTRIKADADRSSSFVIPFVNRNRFALALVSIILLIASAVIIYINLFRPTPIMPTPDKKVKEQTFVSEEQKPLPEAHKDIIVTDKRLADNHVDKKAVSPKISQEREMQAPTTLQPPVMSQESQEQTMTMTFEYKNPDIKVIWIYKS